MNGVPGQEGWTRQHPLVMSCEQRDGRAIVAIEGEIDLATAPQLADYLRDVGGDVVVDLDRVEFLDSSGIATLVRARLRADRHGSSIVLRNPQPCVRRTLEVTGLESWIQPPGQPS